MKDEGMKKVIYLLTLTALMAACRKPYDPPAIANAGSYLVVSGVINSGADSTTINLSRTVSLSSKVTNNPVTGAAVTVESDQNTVYALNETTNGNYVSAGLNLDNTRQYRLRIKTPDNQQYLSDFVPVVITPPIDSIGYNIVNTPATGIQIYVNTHDAGNKVKYFRWDYDENWAFHAKYASYYVSNGSELVVRQANQQVTVCYTGDVSTDIVLNSSAKLQKDVIYQAPVAFISSTSEKIESIYSIYLRQYALTADAYTFWTNLKTNTEQLGSIFDAQPSLLPGNIHNITNPQQPVVGYVSVGTVSKKRFNISNFYLPAWVATYPYVCSDADTVVTYGYNYYNNLVHGPLIATGPPPLPGDVLPSILNFTTRPCADCTIRGSATPPPFFQ
jgi:uncharacterized lipoprotein YajG